MPETLIQPSTVTPAPAGPGPRDAESVAPATSPGAPDSTTSPPEAPPSAPPHAPPPPPTPTPELLIGDEAGRVRMAANPNTPQRLLRSLARDPSVKVRAALAMNPSAPPDLDATILQDGDERVRALLGHRLAALMPSLGQRHSETMLHQAMTALQTLVIDEALRVRRAIAEVLKDMAEAPRELILRLAQDSSMDVAEPVIRLSPVLTTEDLLNLLAISPRAETATAVARRPHLSAPVSDAIAASAHHEAIAALLANPTASIREMTIDALIVRAVDHVAWHEPLARRQHLSARSARALSQILSAQLIGVLTTRADLSPDLLHELQERLGQALEPRSTPNARAPTMDEAMAEARSLAHRHALVEATLLEAARRGEVRMCTAMLAVAADVPVFVVERASTLRSAKGMVSLVWKAGFSMKAAQPLQIILVRLPPEAVMGPTETGGFPLGDDEMRWQIQFLTRMWR